MKQFKLSIYSDTDLMKYRQLIKKYCRLRAGVFWQAKGVLTSDNASSVKRTKEFVTEYGREYQFSVRQAKLCASLRVTCSCFLNRKSQSGKA